MKASTIVASFFFLPLAGAFSVPSGAASRRQVGEAIVGGAASFLVPLPASAADEEGYVATDRGLKYRVVTPPTDPASATPLRAQKVKARYTLYLNGFPEDNSQAKKIDSSKGPLGEKPFEFLAGVSQVIKGWDLSVMEMREGEARKLVIPPEIGYGDKGTGPIPGGATLYFDMELVEIGKSPNINADQEKWLAENPL